MTVLGRDGWRSDQVTLFVFHKNILGQEELGRSLHDGIGLPEELNVTRVEVVLPEVLAEPGATGWPHAPLSTIDRRGPAPDVRVVMRHPAVGPVMYLCGLTSRRLQLADHAQQRFV
jgi:hypothetical protein